jgi:hypothetical protein
METQGRRTAGDRACKEEGGRAGGRGGRGRWALTKTDKNANIPGGRLFNPNSLAAPLILR